MTDRGEAILHGSGAGDIATFEPRQADDTQAFGAQRAVYASTDGIWPIFFAVVHRSRYRGGLVNTCVEYLESGARGYYFSLDATALPTYPWRAGTVYLLPPAGFVPDDVVSSRGERVRPAQSVSRQPVVPMARLRVEPTDFPFLDQVQGHDEATLQRRAVEEPGGFPWRRLDHPRE